MTEHTKQPAPRPALGNARRKTVWQEAAKRLLQAERARYDYSYKELARAMGDVDSEQSLITRINRGTFSFAFFLQAVRAMGSKTIDISHLPSSVRKGDRGA